MNRPLTFKLARDKNGNKTCKVQPPSGRAFSIQTNSNLPDTHRHGVNTLTESEVRAYVRDFGNARQKSVFGL